MRKRTQDPAPDPMIGRTIHEFRIEKKLAEGGMGVVYLARHRLMTSTLKVIKVLLPEYARNPVLHQRFHREAEAASKLKHENILGIDNFGTLDDGQPFIMVPYLDGQPLDAYLQSRGGGLSPYRALHLVVQLCDALDDAHALGIIHRDLKPGNVFLIPTSSNPYMLKLLDFGIAKMIGAQDGGPKTQRGIAIGTPGYMAVEQYEHADEVTHLADVYSLAVMIWAIVAGRPPWQHPDPAVLYFLQRTELPERPPADVMPAEWADILLAAMSVDPGARPQSARELAMALASALPAVGRLPSGAEILAGLAPHFVRKAAPGDETVRNASEVDRIGPLLWPPRETAPDVPRGVPRSNAEPPPAAEPDAAGSPAEPPAAAERALAASPAGLPTTLSAATGVTSVLGEPRSRRRKLTLAAAGTAVVAALATGTLATRVSSNAASSPGAAVPGSPEVRPDDAGSGSADARSSPSAPDAAPAAAATAAPPVSPARASTPARESTSTADTVGAPVPDPVREPASELGSAGPAPDARVIRADSHEMTRSGTRAPAAGARLPARAGGDKDSAAKPAENMRSVSGKARRPAVIDPDDVSGSEE